MTFDAVRSAAPLLGRARGRDPPGGASGSTAAAGPSPTAAGGDLPRQGRVGSRRKAESGVSQQPQSCGFRPSKPWGWPGTCSSDADAGRDYLRTSGATASSLVLASLDPKRAALAKELNVVLVLALKASRAVSLEYDEGSRPREPYVVPSATSPGRPRWMSGRQR